MHKLNRSIKYPEIWYEALYSRIFITPKRYEFTASLLVWIETSIICEWELAKNEKQKPRFLCLVFGLVKKTGDKKREHICSKRFDMHRINGERYCCIHLRNGKTNKTNIHTIPTHHSFPNWWEYRIEWNITSTHETRSYRLAATAHTHTNTHQNAIMFEFIECKWRARIYIFLSILRSLSQGNAIRTQFTISTNIAFLFHK